VAQLRTSRNLLSEACGPICLTKFPSRQTQGVMQAKPSTLNAIFTIF